MSSDRDRPSSSPPPRTDDVAADLHAKLDRVIGLCAATVTQIDRLTRILTSNQQLEARSKRDHAELMTENRAMLMQVREVLTVLIPRPRSSRKLLPSHDEEGSFDQRRRDDNSQITASLKLQIRGSDEKEGEDSKRPVKKVIVAVLKGLAGVAAGALGHYLLGK
jgi:hypothetical protein